MLTAELIGPPRAAVVTRLVLELRADGSWGPEEQPDSAVGDWFREHGLRADVVSGDWLKFCADSATGLVIYSAKDAPRIAFPEK